jgi:hypothetical protein
LTMRGSRRRWCRGRGRGTVEVRSPRCGSGSGPCRGPSLRNNRNDFAGPSFAEEREYLHERLPTLEPVQRGQLALRLLQYVPEPWLDSCVDSVMIHGNVGLDVFPRVASRLNARQLDRALSLVEDNGSRGGERDGRLEALAAIGFERLRRAHSPNVKTRLQKLLHDTLHARAETRAEVLPVLSAMAPLIVALGGTPAAIGVVGALRRVGEWWP